jgi:hypothetical protein
MILGLVVNSVFGRAIYLSSVWSNKNLMTQKITSSVMVMESTATSKKLITVSIRAAPWICGWVRQPLAHCQSVVSNRICAKSFAHQRLWLV